MKTNVSTVVKSLLDRPSEEVAGPLERIGAKVPQLVAEGLLGQAEWRAIEFIGHTLASGSTPTEAVFLSRFTGAGAKLAAAQRLPVADAESLFDVLMAERRRERDKKQFSARLQSLSVRVRQDGLTENYRNELVSLQEKMCPPTAPTVPLDMTEVARLSYCQRKESVVGLRSGVSWIDDAIGGMTMGSLSTVLGYTGQFKTLWLITIAYNNCVEYGYNCVFISLEMTAAEIRFALLARHSAHPKFEGRPAISRNAIRAGTLSAEEDEFLWQVVAPDFDAQKGKVVVLEGCSFRSLAPGDVFATLSAIDDRFKAQQGADSPGIEAMLWDHLQSFKSGGLVKTLGARDEYAVLNTYVDQLLSWSLNFRGRETIQVLVSQANRGGWERAQRRKGAYDLRAVAEANQIERSSARVLSVYVDERLKFSREAKVQILKNRFGETTSEALAIAVDPERMLFGDGGPRGGVDHVGTTREDLDALFGGPEHW